MSTATLTKTTADLDRQLNDTILQGDILGALDRFYAEDVVMQENLAEPTVGKAANHVRERAFLDSVEQFHGAALLSSAVNGDVTFGEWDLDLTFKSGPRTKMTQVAVRRWKDGLIVHERFYYSKG